MTELQSLRLKNMLQFVGDIPSEIGKLTNLKLLDLACTPFQTPLPTELARLSGLDVVLAFRCNKDYDFSSIFNLKFILKSSNNNWLC